MYPFARDGWQIYLQSTKPINGEAIVPEPANMKTCNRQSKLKQRVVAEDIPEGYEQSGREL